MFPAMAAIALGPFDMFDGLYLYRIAMQVIYWYRIAMHISKIGIYYAPF